MFNLFELPKRLRSTERDLSNAQYDLKHINKKHAEEVESIRAEHRLEVKKLRGHITGLEEKNTKLTDTLSAYQEREENYVDITKREAQMDIKEGEFNAASEVLAEERGKIDSKIKSVQKEADAKLEAANEKAALEAKSQYQNGYGDGVADGLRKAHEITADDRRMAMQVAGLAAASHSTEASQKLAEGFTEPALKSLGDGKSSAKK